MIFYTFIHGILVSQLSRGVHFIKVRVHQNDFCRKNIYWNLSSQDQGNLIQESFNKSSPVIQVHGRGQEYQTFGVDTLGGAGSGGTLLESGRSRMSRLLQEVWEIKVEKAKQSN